MAHQLSDVVSVRVDSATGVMKTISGSVNSVTIDGGNGLVDDTGMGDSSHTEIRDIGPVKKITLNGFIDTTTEAIILPLVAAGTSQTKSIEIGIISGKYISGETNVGNVSWNAPVGLQTWSAEYSSTSGDGFDHTSVAI